MSRAAAAHAQAESPVSAAEARGDTLEPQTRVDADLRGLPGTDGLAPPRRVTPPRRRRPDEVGIIYQGNRKGAQHAQAIDLIVPDQDNDAWVSDLQEVIPQMDEDTLRQQHDELAAARAKSGRAVPDYHPLRETLHGSGPSYHFTLHETTLVNTEDAAFLLAHPSLRFERANQARTR